VDICHPSTDPCAHGQCRIGRNNPFSCFCDVGWKGQLCDIDIDECASDPCSHKGVCQDQTAAYNCLCQGTGWTGENCEIDENDCYNLPCKNGAACFDLGNGTGTYSCDCGTTGYTGLTCEEDIDDCADTPCKNNGTCKDTGRNMFTCDCKPPSNTTAGWKGLLCDVVMGKLESGKDTSGEEKVSAGEGIDEETYYVIAIVVLAFTLCILLLMCFRFSRKKAKRMIVSEQGDTFLVDERTGATKKAKVSTNQFGDRVAVEDSDSDSDLVQHVDEIKVAYNARGDRHIDIEEDMLLSSSDDSDDGRHHRHPFGARNLPTLGGASGLESLVPMGGIGAALGQNPFQQPNVLGKQSFGGSSSSSDSDSSMSYSSFSSGSSDEEEE
jgi:hypothetical protein